MRMCQRRMKLRSSGVGAPSGSLDGGGDLAALEEGSVAGAADGFRQLEGFVGVLFGLASLAEGGEAVGVVRLAVGGGGVAVGEEALVHRERFPEGLLGLARAVLVLDAAGEVVE